MYILIRILILMILSILILYRKQSKKEENTRILYIIIIVIVIFILSVSLPIEDLFYTFNSAESVFKYENYQGEITDIIQGKNSSMILYCKNNVPLNIIIPKKEKGWKIGSQFLVKNVSNKYYKNKIIGVYQYHNTDDYFILINDDIVEENQQESIISDNCSSQFKVFSTSIEDTDKKNIVYYAYLRNFDENYVLTIDGKKIKLK